MHGNSGEAQPKFELPSNPQGVEGTSDGIPEVTTTAPEVKTSIRTPVSSTQNDQSSSIVKLPPDPTTVPDDEEITGTTNKREMSGRRTPPANDNDRIEREWIDRAKSIVIKSQNDPHKQNSEMSRVKAEYIKKRFNKNIPTDDTVTA